MEKYDIVEKFNECRTDISLGKSAARIKKKYACLKRDYPDLLEKLLAKQVSDQEADLFMFMIQTREAQRNNQISAETANDLVATRAASLFMPSILALPEKLKRVPGLKNLRAGIASMSQFCSPDFLDEIKSASHMNIEEYHELVTCPEFTKYLAQWASTDTLNALVVSQGHEQHGMIDGIDPTSDSMVLLLDVTTNTARILMPGKSHQFGSARECISVWYTISYSKTKPSEFVEV